ncbi:2-amino-4-hydroxy-6-hydroxymethyldihydropteridine diphosphokinase [uncultured Porphyromonas sp.]|uniref:2-amino-4-hydroxy-6- hydroxymethyldihydropteridine diphosphokinase n=1 Tax=uncultured Porphyromonas sp. TaxID=159274 RepID=UPI002628645E|nr:2-amino-4-hydroxy-6-hydroxymethyldihydropteridine diphosphokinase [uncultured Porphyromonas sp.]
MAKLYLSLGSNEGDREMLLRAAIDAIDLLIGPVDGISPFIETEPWGFESKHPFLNIALSVETDLPAMDVLDRTQEIERQLGRQRKSVAGQYEDRPIDIDLLCYDDLVLSTERLTLPHPLLQERLFVLDPLAEIAPQFLHPTLGKTIQTLRDELRLRLD